MVAHVTMICAETAVAVLAAVAGLTAGIAGGLRGPIRQQQEKVVDVDGAVSAGAARIGTSFGFNT